MKQTSLSVSGFELQSKRTRRREFLSEMYRVIPWADLVALILSQAPSGKAGPPTVCSGDDAADPHASTVLWAQRPSGRGVAQ